MSKKYPMRTASLLLAVTLLGTAGCGAATVPAEGVLLWDDNGKPVNGASLRFVPVTGSQEAIGFTDKDGAFSLSASGAASGAMPGEYKVVVTKSAAGPTIKGEATSPEDLAKAMKGTFKEKGAQSPAKIVDPVPAVYWDEKTTPLTCKVEPGKKIELKIKRS